jgi:transaldolase
MEEYKVMQDTSIRQLGIFGQSVWVDNISRQMIKTGRIKEMIGLGLRGMTSNPTIFDKAISASSDYDEDITELCDAGKTTFEIYDELTVKDIRDAADIFLPVYKETAGLDGYVSLEINPKLAHNAEETIKEGRRIHQKVGRPNLMVKVPSTEAGFRAIEELLAGGININATLIFSLGQYINTVEAYLRGMKRFMQDKKDTGIIRSVASVFVSRTDASVDGLLEQLASKEQSPEKTAQIISLKGKAAVSNCALIYKKYLDIFSSGRSAQRVLWASTSTKNPEYSDIKYVTDLIAKNTVNTMPEQTFDAFLGHGKVKESLTQDVSVAEKVISDLKELGIDVNDICAQLLMDGVAAFEKSFDSLLSSIDKKKTSICKK